MEFLDSLTAGLLFATPFIVAVALLFQTTSIAKFANGAAVGVRVWIPMLAVVGAILFLSSARFSAANTLSLVTPVIGAVAPGVQPATALSLNNLLRKGAHYGEYGLLFLVAVHGPLHSRRITALGLCLLVALADEGHQALLPERTGLLQDVEVDFVGALVAAVVELGLARLLNSRALVPERRLGAREARD